MPSFLFSLLAAPALAATTFCALGEGRAVTGSLAAFQPRRVLPSLAAVPVVAEPAVSGAAKARAEAMIDEMLAQSPGVVRFRLRSGGVSLVIIPQDKKLTDLPQFRSLRGVRLPDGRVWDDVRGVGFVSQDDGTVALGVGEENLRDDGLRDGYRKGFLLAHELGHAVHGYGLSEPDSRKIEELYGRRKLQDLPFQSAYARSTMWEYFAVGASAFFQLNERGELDDAWVQREDAPLHERLRGAFGLPRPAWR